ncbi:hypothetical protein [Candidatus Contendibacter odensensis]|uniref:Uncharacterized protein n=1 Tax=Candidatus Contendobacter odensis Run_B_J11 TaxID=1400861 RepID=A0A7U7J437_9GAMM|nr:hypothetical protein [Candidatus Contendobacter odensis]CDH44837.1 conserved membrane hypothetical protein [Candidatus Contendobacter odensis Run_B_J11]
MNHPQGGRPRSRRVLPSAALYFGIVFGVGFLLGSVRVPFLVPRLGERVAELAEMPFMFAAIFLAAGHVVRKYGASVAPLGWVRVGTLSLAFLVAAELLLAVVLAGRGIGEYIASRDPVSGSVYLALLVVFAAMPWLRRRLDARLSGGPSHEA